MEQKRNRKKREKDKSLSKLFEDFYNRGFVYKVLIRKGYLKC